MEGFLGKVIGFGIIILIVVIMYCLNRPVDVIIAVIFTMTIFISIEAKLCDINNNLKGN